MTKSASTQAILAILVGGTLAAPVGCKVEQVPIGQQDSGGQTTSATGGSGGGTPSGGGAIANGGSAKTGGIAATGGVLGAGGSTASGGSTKTGGIPAVGGANAGGGTTGLGGSGAGGSTGCAPGWTMCCGQCLSPSAGICAQCSAGGAGPMGGASSTGGRGGASAGGTGAGGATGVGGAGVGGATGAGGAGAGGAGSGGASGVTCGGLLGTATCSTSQFCDLPAGSCNSADMTGTCVAKSMVCSAIYQPVCGCDGKTYASDCYRISAGVTKKSSGACATTDAGVCPANETWCPGCPSLGIAGGCGQVCPAIACLAPDAGTSDAASGSCSAITTQAACDSRSDCHSVFADPGTCGCAGVNCCMHFNHCADGGQPNCAGPAACAIAQPACLPPYTLGYTSSCFEGCVLQTKCAKNDAG